MKKSDFMAKVDMAVEVEYEFGGRNWNVMKADKVDEFIKNLAEDECLSDIDYSYKQEFVECRELLDKAQDIWFNDRTWWQERKMTSLDEVIDALLEDDETPEPEKVLSREQFDKAVSLCQIYDPFTMYIESYEQELSAERRNDRITEEFSKLMETVGLDIKYVPCTNCGRKTEAELLEWLSKYNVKVEEKKQEEPKAKRIWTQEEIGTLIQTNDEVLYRALRKLYEQQTADEQRVGETKLNNNAGFNATDAKFLSSTAEFLKKTGFLTAKQKVVVRKKMVKYTKQLTKLANA